MVYEEWQWNVAKQLRSNSTILIQFENYWLLYGLHNLNSPKRLEELKAVIPNSLFCIDNGFPVSFILIKRSDWTPPIKKLEFFNFLYPYKAKDASEYIHFKKFFGKVLLINLETLNDNNLNELELTIAHEAMHLFGQEAIQNAEPIFHPAYEAIETDHKEKYQTSSENSANNCYHSIHNFDHQSGRDYLEFKLKCSPSFKKSVINEICINLKLVNFINSNSKSTASNRLHVAILIKEIIEELENRVNLYNDSDLPIEWYWYLLEGVPQFMEQKILFRKNPERLINQYDAYCHQKNGHEDYFYPLLTGAAIWHGLDYLFDSPDDWGYKATQKEYNIPSEENPNFWFNNFKLLLNNEIKKTLTN